MDDLLSLVQASEDNEHQKLFVRFIVKTLQIFEEEVVENSSEAVETEFELRARCKDFIREGPIGKIVELLSQILNNGSVFQKNTIKGVMKLLSLLIDWNDLSYFQGFVETFKQSVGHKHFRIGGFYCIGAICGKGMEIEMKLKIINEIGYTDILNQV